MPLYEYQCDACGDVFEVMQKFSDEPLTSHEKCGGGPVHRLLSAPALQFKGSGWYITDYAKNSGAKGNGSATETKDKADSGSGKASSDAAKTSSSPSEGKSGSTSDTK